MAQQGGDRGRKLGRPREALPVVAVRSPTDMAVMLARHYPVLRERARRYLRVEDITDAEIDEVVRSSVDRLLAIENPSYDNGLRFATGRILWEECQRFLKSRAVREPLVDKKLGPLNHPAVARVLQFLTPLARNTLVRAAQGETAEDIARSENSTTETVEVRISRARRRVRQLLAEQRNASTAVLALLPHRLRGLVGRMVPLLAEHIGPQAVATTALVPLIAASLWWTGPVAPAAPPAAAIALAPMHGAVLPITTTSAAARPAASTPPPVSVSPPITTVTPVPATSPILALPLRGAAAETPDDVVLKASATPADGRPVIVAIGKGNTCVCPVLLQSLDGGASWSATDGPPASANQVVLPPTYPHDARIFVGVDPSASAGPYVAASFDQPFQALSPLPAGQLAVSAHFDDGDARLFSSAGTAVWSVRLDTAGPLVPRDEIDYSAASASGSAVAALSTPAPSPGGPALLAWAPGFAAVPGTATPPPPNPVVLTCPTAGPCAETSTIPSPPWQLASSGSSGTVVAYTRTAAFISHDGGASFSPLHLPPGTTVVASVALVGPGAVPWVSFSRGGGSSGVSRLTPSSSWVDVTADSGRLRTYAARLVPVGADRVVAAFSEVGYRCALVSGGTWMPRCPAA
jgi:hypothetical protein